MLLYLPVGIPVLILAGYVGKQPNPIVLLTRSIGWLAASFFILLVGLAMVNMNTPLVSLLFHSNMRQADLASAMPTAGGLYFWTHHFASEKWRNPLSFVVGYSNTIGLIGGLCSIDCTWRIRLLSWPALI